MRSLATSTHAVACALELQRAQLAPIRLRIEPRSGLGMSGCFLGELYPGADAEFGVDVGEVGLHGAR
jgi:hypothetical protein